MIVKFKNQGFKDQNKCVELCGLDLFTSRNINGAGKSAALESFKLGLLGEIPGRAKCLDDIMSFTSRDEMAVHLFAKTARGDIDFERRFLRDDEKGEKRPIRINGVQKKYEESHRWIQEKIGAVSISFDPYEFLNLTDSKKRQWIVAHSPESFRMRKSGVRLLALARLAEKYLGSGVVRSLLSSLGIDRLPMLPGPDWDHPGAADRLMTLLREQDPILFECIQKALRSVFSLWPESSSGDGGGIDKLLAFLKSETGRLRSLVREQSACINVLRKQAFIDGIFSLDKRVEEKRISISNLARRIRGVETVLAQEHFCNEESKRKRERHDCLIDRIAGLEEKLADNKLDVFLERACNNAPRCSAAGSRAFLNKLRRSLDEKCAETANAEGVLRACRDELQFIGEIPQEIDAARLENEKLELESEKRAGENSLETLFRSQGKLEILQELELRRCGAELELEVALHINSLLGPEGIQGAMAASVAAELEKEVNGILRLINVDYEFTLETSGKHFEMGWSRDGKLIPLNTINSSHFILFAVPFLTALLNRLALSRARQGLPTLKALCIEGEALAPASLSSLLKGLALMKKKGFLDNVLVAHYASLGSEEKLHGFKEHVFSVASDPQGGAL